MNALIESNSSTAIALSDVPRSEWDASVEYRLLSLQGTFEAESQTLLRKQTLNGEPGFSVLTMLVTPAGERLLVNRGWVRGEGQSPAADVDLVPPSGVVNISGRLHSLSGELVEDPKDLPSGQTNSMAWQARTADFELVLEQQEPELANGPTPIPLPEIQAGPHLGYVGQWILIGIASISVYVTVLRNLRRELRTGSRPRQPAN